jgi:beta-phosphoglucomutase family hydrolase
LESQHTKISIPDDIKGLIFDCDGTLANTMPIHHQAWHDAFRKYGQEVSEDFLNSMKGAPATTMVSTFNDKFGTDLDAEKVVSEKQRLVVEKLPKTKPFKVVADFVPQNHGNRPMAVVSGGNRKNVIITLKAIGLLDYFETVITADDDVEPKPAPDIFLKAAEQIKIEPHACMVFEDGDYGLEGAQKAGMQTVDVRPFTV